MNGYDVIVVGAGAMGSAAAWRLAKRGRKVAVLERFSQGHVRGGSHGASRVFRLAYPEVDYVRLAQAALPQWRELETESGRRILDQTGGVDHGEPADLRSIAQALAACGVPYERLTPEEAEKRWTGMRFDREVLFQPDAGRTNADVALTALNDTALKLGSEFHFGEGVRSLTLADGGVIVQTERDEYRAPIAVLAVGSWAPKLLKGLVSLPEIRVTQEQPAHFQPVDVGATWPSFIHHEDVSDSGLASFGTYGLLTPGEGVKVGEHGTGVTVDPDDRDFTAEPTRLRRLKKYVSRWLPGLNAESAEPISCLYDTSPTEDFVVDRLGPLVVATGFSGHGFKFTPEIGRIATELAEGKDASLPRFRLAAHLHAAAHSE